MKTKRALLILTICVAILIVSIAIYKPVDYYPFLSNQVKKYHGDGVIKDISLRFVVCPVKGYSITFPKFHLDSTFEKTYRLSNLPVINYDIGLYFIVEGLTYYWDAKNRKDLKGSVEISLYNSKHEQVMKVEKSLGDFVWSNQFSDSNGYELYDKDNSFFQPVKNESYTLNIKYSPDANLGQAKGYFLLRGGGSLI